MIILFSGFSFLTTSQYPPFVGPARCKRPCFFSFPICFSTARVDKLIDFAISFIVICGERDNLFSISLSV